MEKRDLCGNRSVLNGSRCERGAAREEEGKKIRMGAVRALMAGAGLTWGGGRGVQRPGGRLTWDRS